MKSNTQKPKHTPGKYTEENDKAKELYDLHGGLSLLSNKNVHKHLKESIPSHLKELVKPLESK